MTRFSGFAPAAAGLAFCWTLVDPKSALAVPAIAVRPITPAGMINPDAPPAEAYASGKAALAKGDARQALAHFRAALRVDPAYVAALSGAAVALEQLGRSDLARPYFEAAVAVQPDRPDLLFNLGLSLSQLGMDKLARPLLQKAAALDQGETGLRSLRVLAQLDRPANAALMAAATAVQPLPAAPAAAPQSTIQPSHVLAAVPPNAAAPVQFKPDAAGPTAIAAAQIVVAAPLPAPNPNPATTAELPEAAAGAPVAGPVAEFAAIQVADLPLGMAAPLPLQPMAVIAPTPVMQMPTETPTPIPAAASAIAAAVLRDNSDTLALQAALPATQLALPVQVASLTLAADDGGLVTLAPPEASPRVYRNANDEWQMVMAQPPAPMPTPPLLVRWRRSAVAAAGALPAMPPVAVTVRADKPQFVANMPAPVGPQPPHSAKHAAAAPLPATSPTASALVDRPLAANGPAAVAAAAPAPSGAYFSHLEAGLRAVLPSLAPVSQRLAELPSGLVPLIPVAPGRRRRRAVTAAA